MRRVGKYLLVTLAVVILVPVAIYLVVNVVAVIEASRTRDRVADLATERLADELPGLRSERSGLDATVQQEPLTTWIDQSCNFTTEDAGWIVQSYRETCTLKASTAWPAADLATAQGLAGRTGDDVLDQRTGAECIVMGEPVAETTWTWVGEGLDVADDGWCAGISGPWEQARTVEGEPLAGRTTEGLLVSTTTIPLLDEDIGCTHWSVLFCDNPFGDEHAFGDPPG